MPWLGGRVTRAYRILPMKRRIAAGNCRTRESFNWNGCEWASNLRTSVGKCPTGSSAISQFKTQRLNGGQSAVTHVQSAGAVGGLVRRKKYREPLDVFRFPQPSQRNGLATLRSL